MNPWATPQAYNNMKDFFETGVSWSNNVNVAQRFDKVTTPFLWVTPPVMVSFHQPVWIDIT